MTTIRPAMAFHPFGLEEWQSRWEHRVEINLADSGVLPISLRQLRDLGANLEPLLDLPLHYPEVNGTLALRRRIAALYRGVEPENVLVTVGAAEANAIAAEALVGPGDEVVVVTPAYAQVAGVAENRGATVRRVQLVEERGWTLDVDALAAAVTPSTRLVALTNPNNPTGAILTAAEMDAVVEIVGATDAWLLADEVYRGSERLSDVETPTFVGRLERIVSINSLSKSYALPGLRLGWAVAPTDLVEDLWRRHEYATIAASAPSMLIAEQVLRADVRARLLDRNRGVVRRSYAILEAWASAHADVVTLVPPRATALAFLGLPGEASSISFAERLRDEHGVLVAPGAYFDVEGHVRVSHGLDPARLPAALDRLAAALRG